MWNCQCSCETTSTTNILINLEHRSILLWQCSMFNALVHDEWSQLAEDRKLSACQPQSWRISAYLPLQKVLRTKTMHHVVGDKARQWIPVGSFSWEAFFKDDWGQNNLLEWCEWGIAVLSRIEHSSGPSSWEFSSNSFLLHLPALDPDPWHWKKQTLERKDFSRPVGDTLPSHFLLQPTFLLNSGAYWNYRAQNVD